MPVRSVLKCEAVTGVCQACYGRSMASGPDRPDRRRGRHHRRAVDRRAGHAADHADVPHRRRRRRGHHARPAACRGALRGAQAQGPRADHRARRRRPHRGDRQGPHRGHHRRRRRGAPPHVPAAHAPVRGRGREGRRGPPAQRGLAVPARPAQAPRPDRDRALPRQGGAGGLQVPGRGHQRQAHRADRAPDAQEGPRRPEGRHDLPAGPVRRPLRLRPRERRASRTAAARPRSSRRSSSASRRPR